MRLAFLSAAVLLLAGCARNPAPTADEVTATLADAQTGRIAVGRLGTATLTQLRVKESKVEGDRATVLVAVKAEQSGLNERYHLAAELRLHYERQQGSWVLTRTEEVKPWTDRTPKPREPRVQRPVGDSEAIQQLQRARRAARLRVEQIPYGP
jgi:hypothetical protein